MNNIESKAPATASDPDTTRFEHKFFWWALWTLVGTAFVIIGYFTDFTPYFSEKIAQRLASPPFFLPQTAFDNPVLPSSILFFLGIAITMFLVFAMLNAGSLGRKLIIWISLIVLTLAPILIAALWQYYLPMVSACLSLFIAGIGTMITPHTASINPFKKTSSNTSTETETSPEPSDECP